MRNRILFILIFSFLYFSNAYCLYLGDGTDEYQKYPVFIMNDIIDVYSDGHTTLFLKSDNSLWGCGENMNGQLGNIEKTSYSIPIKIQNNVISFCCSYGTITYVTCDGKMYIRGRIPKKVRIDNTIEFINSADPIFCAENVTRCYVFNKSFYFITNDNDLYSFGNNNRGQLGDGSKISRITAKKIMKNIKELTNSDYGAVLALDQFGNVIRFSEKPKIIFKNAKKIKGNFVLSEKDELYVIGLNLYGSMGLDIGKNYEEYVFLMDEILDMDGNQDHSLIITKDNDLFVCGGGDVNQRKKATGDGEVHYKPFFLDTIKKCNKAYVGGTCSFVITINNELYAFGVNSQDDYSGL